MSSSVDGRDLQGFASHQGFCTACCGFTPDIEIDENDPYGRGDGYYIYRDYGSDKEFLYARAIQEITGQAPVPTTRSAL